MTPLFDHSCPNSQYLGTFFAHDVYLTDLSKGTVLARYSSEPSGYHSTFLATLRLTLIRDPGFVFSELSHHIRAMIIALLLRGIDT